MASHGSTMEALQPLLESKLSLTFGAILVLIIATRILSSVLGASKSTPNGTTVPLAPYWIPLIGHVPQFFFFRRGFFGWACDTYNNGAFGINMFGTTHNVIFSPALGQTMLNQKNEVADSHSTAKYIMHTIFAYPKSKSEEYDRTLGDLVACYRELQTQPGLPKLVDGLISQLKVNINNFVSFSTSLVDQPYWERVSGSEVINLPGGEQAVEADLYTLVRDFVALSANPALFGTDFINNNPQIWEDLWNLDRGFMMLATGLPRWIPLPGLAGAVVARKRLIEAIKPFEIAMEKWTKGEDPGSEWSDMDNTSELFKARVKVYNEHNVSLEGRTSLEMTLFWAMNANANPLVFWILCRVYADPTLLEDIRREIRPYMKIRMPNQDFAIEEQPTLEGIDHDGLTDKCPLLKAAYIECMRLDTAVWSFKIMQQDLSLTAREKDAAKFVIKKGTYCHIAHELHHRSPAFHEDPDEWRVARHLKYTPAKNGSPGITTADMGTVRPYGGGHSMCKGRQFALKEILIATATVFTFWDMEPASGGEWVLPKPVQATGTNGIKGQYRVRIKRRSIPAS